MPGDGTFSANRSVLRLKVGEKLFNEAPLREKVNILSFEQKCCGIMVHKTLKSIMKKGRNYSSSNGRQHVELGSFIPLPQWCSADEQDRSCGSGGGSSGKISCSLICSEKPTRVMVIGPTIRSRDPFMNRLFLEIA